MPFIHEVFDVLTTLFEDGGAEDPTFQRMISTYREVSELLGCRAEYERMVSGLLRGGTAADVPENHTTQH
jgi:hypothetical protein